ncbi:MAG: hypothetical protein NTX56_16715 [Proteobacteria bacterium]|nr:hypothetical protein [Pseudomonadota bacterium]
MHRKTRGGQNLRQTGSVSELIENVQFKTNPHPIPAIISACFPQSGGSVIRTNNCLDTTLGKLPFNIAFAISGLRGLLGFIRAV